MAENSSKVAVVARPIHRIKSIPTFAPGCIGLARDSRTMIFARFQPAEMPSWRFLVSGGLHHSEFGGWEGRRGDGIVGWSRFRVDLWMVDSRVSKARQYQHWIYIRSGCSQMVTNMGLKSETRSKKPPAQWQPEPAPASPLVAPTLQSKDALPRAPSLATRR